ncbi:MAG: hypothetical protein ACREXY_16970, partial [Gammaproteobacteria bacterium]
LCEVTGDRYAGEWPRERFLVHGIHYRISDLTKSQIYQAALPMLNSHRVELLDNKRLRAQVLGLERRTARGGKDSIDHRPGGHDDLANAALGALSLAQPLGDLSGAFFGTDTDLPYQIPKPWIDGPWAEETAGIGPAYFLPLR